MEKEIEQNFVDLIKLLNNNKVEYCICGAISVMHYRTIPRHTGDIDILIRPTEDNVKKTFVVLEEFIGTSLANTNIKEFIDKQKVLQFGVPPGQIHIMTKISGVKDIEIWPNIEKSEFGDRQTYYLGLNELKKNKKVCSELPGRMKKDTDRNDLQELELVQQKTSKKGLSR